MTARVLLVEANPEHLRLSLEALPKDEFAVDTAGAGCEALQLAQAEEYDLIVIAQPLPDVSGLDLIASFRLRRCPARIVLVSDRGDPHLSLKAMQAGACDFIVKAYRYFELLPERLRENLEHCERCVI